MTIIRLYSIILVSIIMFGLLRNAVKNINKKDFWYTIITLILLMPLWYYIIFYSIAV